MAESVATIPKKTGGKGAAKSKAVKRAAKETNGGSTPTTAVMVIEAVTKLAERGGSSLYAIKKQLAEVHSVDLEKQKNNIKKAVKKLVDTGKLVQTKGTGASGSFKLASSAEAKKKPVKKATESSSSSAKPIKAAKKTMSKKVGPASAAKKTKKDTGKVKAAVSTSSPVEKKSTAPKEPKLKLPKTLKKPAATVAKAPKKVAPKTK